LWSTESKAGPNIGEGGGVASPASKPELVTDSSRGHPLVRQTERL
jgi:hypothetical protein